MRNHTFRQLCRVGRQLLRTSVPLAVASLITLPIAPAQAQPTPESAPSRLAWALAADPVPEQSDPAYGAGEIDSQTLGAPSLTLDPSPGASQATPESLQEINRKLSNPVSDVWALFTEFDLFFSDGKGNTGGDQVGARMLFQPIMPIPLYGQGQGEWKLVTRPTLPVLFSQPLPTGPDQFTHLGGLGDLQIPTMLAPPLGKTIFGLGPGWLFPTATRTEFGRQQWGVGPSGVFGYATKEFTAVVLPQYYFGIDGWGDKPDASYLNLLYAFIYHLPGGWDIGTNPTVNYDHTASSGNRWNVPVGLFVGKMVKLGRMPVKFQLGLEYSVVKSDDFGQQAQIKLNIIPVIPSLVRHPVFGGN